MAIPQVTNSQIVIPPIPPPQTLADLRLSVSNALGTLASQLNTQRQTSTFNMNNYRIINLGMPVTPNDAATKQYVDDKVGRGRGGRNIITNTGGTSIGAITYLIDKTWTANGTVTSPGSISSVGDQLFVFIRQDGTGGPYHILGLPLPHHPPPTSLQKPIPYL